MVVSMKIKNLLFLASVLLASSAHAMHDNQVITLISLDKQKFQVQVGVAKQSVTLKHLMEDADIDVPLEVPNVPGATLATILALLKVMKEENQDAQTKIHAALSSLNEAALVQFIAAVNFLDIPLLLQASMRTAETRDLQKMPLEQFIALPKELRNSILLAQAERILGPMHINQIAQLGAYTGMGTVYSVAVTPDGTKIISGSRDGKLRVWDVQTHEEIKQREVFNAQAIDFMRVTPDGTKIVFASMDNIVRVWNAEDFAPLGQFVKQSLTTLTSLCITPDSSKVISGWSDGILCIWDIQSKQAVQLTGHTDTIESIAVTPDGTKIISASHDGVLGIWDTTTYKNITMIKPDAGPVRLIAVTPDGKQIISCHFDGMIRIWDMDTYTEKGAFKADSMIINALCLTPDGTKLITVSADGTLHVWDLGTYREIGTVKGQNILSVAVTPNGSKIISGSDISETQDYEKNAIGIWDISAFSLRSSIMHMSAQEATVLFNYLKSDHAAGWAGIGQIFK